MKCDLHLLLIDCAQKSVACVASVDRVVSLPFLHLHAGYKKFKRTISTIKEFNLRNHLI